MLSTFISLLSFHYSLGGSEGGLSLMFQNRSVSAYRLVLESAQRENAHVNPAGQAEEQD